MANPTLLSRLLCADADKNTIPDTDAGTAGVFSQQYGWQAINSLPLSAGGKAVQRQDFNGVFNLLGGIAFYAQKGYTWQWDSSQDYFVGCIVIDPNDSKRYECISDVTANATPPSADTTHWGKFGTDTAVLANTDLSNLTQTGQDSFLERDFTIIYPNSGTEGSPANVANNSTYVESNPFAGYYVDCIAELYLNAQWLPVQRLDYAYNSGSLSIGTIAMQKGDGTIEIKTGTVYVTQYNSNWQIGVPSAGEGKTSAPCRVKVWKIGKIPT